MVLNDFYSEFLTVKSVNIYIMERNIWQNNKMLKSQVFSLKYFLFNKVCGVCIDMKDFLWEVATDMKWK